MPSAPGANKPFQVDWVTLGNYRRFRVLEFLPSAFNVIVGVNGSGKTTLLQAVAEVFFTFTERVSHPDRGSFRLRRKDTKIGFQSVSVMLGLTAGGKTYLGGLVGDNRGANVDAPELDHELKSLGGDALPTGGVILDLADRYRERLGTEASVSLPTLALYPVNRIELDIPATSEDKQDRGSEVAYEGAFDVRRDFRSFFEWFRERQDAENDLRLDESEYRDAQLQAVREATEDLMEDYRDLRVRHAPLRMTLKKGEEELTTDQLSGGEKALLALVGDLARRMAIANPGLKNPLEGEGVVMIDEVDLHLHPSWQRKVVQRLPETFPNVQFFLTTHSPVVASAVKPESLWVLRDGEIKHAEAYGQDVGLVLSQVFDTPPRLDVVRHDLDELFEAIHRQDPLDAQRRLEALEDMIGPSDPELVQARVMMQGYAIA